MKPRAILWIVALGVGIFLSGTSWAQTITTVAGGGASLGDGGPATSAQLSGPAGSFVDGAGNIYIGDRGNHRVRKVDAVTGIITTIAGNGTVGSSGDGGPATSASLNEPRSVYVSTNGYVYIAEQVGNRVRVVDPSGIITTLVSGISGPASIFSDGTSAIFVAERLGNRILRINVGGSITAIAGTGTAGFSGDGGLATSATLNSPRGVTVDGAGNVYFADAFNQRIRKVDAATGIISTVAGTGGLTPPNDGGPATSANLWAPNSVWATSDGTLYISTHGGQRIRKVDSATGIISTVAGNGATGFSGDGGPATSAALNIPHGVALDGLGNLYISDMGNNRIRKVTGLNSPIFSSIGASAGVDDNSQSEGVAWGDYDQDGDLDIYLSNFGSANRLYRNDGNDTFADVAASAGVADTGGGRGVAFADYDQDGDLDLYLTNRSGTANRLYRNDGGSFAEIAASVGVAATGLSNNISWVDYDQDGDLDLYITKDGSQINHMYRNDSPTSFTDVAPALGLNDGPQGEAIAWGDYDQDGDLDLFGANFNGGNRLYRNDDATSFTDVAPGLGLANTGNGRGAAWGDYDDDGDLDLYVSNGTGPAGNSTNQFFRNDGATFAEIAASLGVADTGNGRGPAWGDYDNDGDLDLHLAGGQTNRLYQNDGSGGFVEVGASAGVDIGGTSEGANWGDYDQDGDLDLYVADYDNPNSLFRNEGNANRWLEIELVGTVSNRDGIGAELVAVASGTRQYRGGIAGTGWLSEPSLPVEFGFGNITTIDSLYVFWPSGITDVQTGVATNQIITIVESGIVPQPLTVAIPDTTATYNEDLLVPVRITDTAGHGIVALELFVCFSSAPSGLLSAFASGVSAGSLTSTWSIESNIASGPGGIDTLKIAMATDTDTLSGAGTLAVLRFSVADQRAPNFSALSIEHLLFNDGTPTATEDPGSVTLVGTDGSIACVVFSSGSTTQVVPGETIDVTVTEADENRNSGSAESLSVQVTNGGQTETVTVTETGAATGIFTGSIATAFSLASTSGDGTIQAQAGDQIQFCFDDSLDAAGATVQRCVSKDVIGGEDGAILTTIVTQPGDTLRVRVTDADLNADPGTQETAQVTATNPTTGESETITLTELDADDSIFFGIVQTASGSVAGPLGDATLNTAKGDVLAITYADQLTAIGGSVTRSDDDEVVDPFGDADGNGSTQAFDAAKVLLHVLSPFLSGTDSLSANLDLLAYDPLQGKITPFDASLILQKRVGLIGRFPVQEDEADNHPQPETDNSTPKLVPDERWVQFRQGSGYISVWMDQREGIVSGDLLLEGIEGRVEMGEGLGEFLTATRPINEGVRLVFAGAQDVTGAGELLRLYGVGPEGVQLVRADFNDGRITGRSEAMQTTAMPTAFALHANVPNPFNPETTIRFDLPQAERVTLEVYDMLGQKVRTLVDQPLSAGAHQVVWNGRNGQGASVASGVYLYRIQTGDQSQIRRMLLLK